MPRARTILSATAAIVAAVVVIFFVGRYYYLHDPASGAAPKCLFKMLTGYDCPGCGSQRALHAFLHGNITEAWHYNPFVFFAVPTAAFYIFAEATRKKNPHLHRVATTPLVIALLIVAVITYTMARNLL